MRQCKDDVINFSEYQLDAMDTAVYPRDKSIEYLGLGLASEAGEVAGKLKRMIREPETSMAHEVMDELGDVLWYVAMLCNEMGFDMWHVAENNIGKLRSRAERGKLKGSGDGR